MVYMESNHRFVQAYEQVEKMKNFNKLIKPEHIQNLIDFTFIVGYKPLWRYEVILVIFFTITGIHYFWYIKVRMAKRFRKNSLIKTAIDIYEKYQLYEELIECYMHIGYKSLVNIFYFLNFRKIFLLIF